MGDRFKLKGFLLERCGRQVKVGRVFVWRDMGDRFKFGVFLLERCGRQIWVGTVFVGEMWATDSSWE